MSCLTGSSQRLVDVYRHWLEHICRQSGPAAAPGQVQLTEGSSAVSCRAGGCIAVLEAFTRRYDEAAAAYNQAVADVNVGVRGLDVAAGELPFFGVFRYRDHHVRCGAFLQGGKLRIGDMTFDMPSDGRLPMDAIEAAGVYALAGKAILLVLQVRYGKNGRWLALPYRGSFYMPGGLAAGAAAAGARAAGRPGQTGHARAVTSAGPHEIAADGNPPAGVPAGLPGPR